MATRSRLFTAQRSGIAVAALLVASMSVHDHRVAVALQQGAPVTGSTAVGSSQPAHLATVAYGVISPSIAHHYP